MLMLWMGGSVMAPNRRAESWCLPSTPAGKHREKCFVAVLIIWTRDTTFTSLQGRWHSMMKWGQRGTEGEKRTFPQLTVDTHHGQHIPSSPNLVYIQAKISRSSGIAKRNQWRWGQLVNSWAFFLQHLLLCDGCCRRLTKGSVGDYI